MARGHLIKVALILATLAGCADEPARDAATTRGREPERASTRPPVRPSPIEGQRPVSVDADCIGGWIDPAPGSELFVEPLEVIGVAMGIEPAFEVSEMRYFVGPESPPVDKGYLQDIQRWYVKGTHASGLRGRWLVERRRFGVGVVAVAPWGSGGFRSPDWMGFQYDSADRTRRRYQGLPGRWAGIPYDFVVGGSGLDNPGLPPELTGCLAGT